MVHSVSPESHPAQDAGFLADAGVVLASAHDEATALARLADLIVPRIADWCVFDMIDEHGASQRAQIVSADPATAHFAGVLQERYPVDLSREDHIVVRVLRSGKPIWTPEVTDAMLVAAARDEEHLRLLRLGNIHSSIIVPLTARGRTLGAITLITSVSGRTFDEADLALAEALAQRAAMAIDVARLLRRAEEAREEAERVANRMIHIQRVTAALSEAVTPPEVAEAVLRAGIAALAADSGLVALLEGDELVVVAHHGGPENLPIRQPRVPLDSPLPVAEAIRTGQAIWARSRAEYVAAHPFFDTPPLLPHDYAIAALPLEIEGRVVGGLGLRFHQPRQFTPEDEAFGLAVAQQCSQALERVRLAEADRLGRAAAERTQARDRFLAETGAVLVESLDWEVTVNQVAHLAVPYFADWCMIDVADEDDRFRRVAIAHADPAKAELADRLRRWPPDPTKTSGPGSVFLTGGSVLISAVQDEHFQRAAVGPQHLAVLRDAGFCSFVAAPLRARGRTFGVIAFSMAESSRHYDQDDRDFAERLAVRAALAIDNARLFQEQVQARTQIQEFAAERALILGQIADGVLIGDLDGRITYANEAAEQIHGDAVVGLDLAAYVERFQIRTQSGQIYPPGELPLSRALHLREMVNNVDLRIRRPDGRIVVAETSAAPVLTDDDRMLGIVLSLHDVTELREFEWQKQAFVMRASHDLKTPLTTIKGYAQVMLQRAERTPEPGRDLSALTAIVDQSQAMQRLLDQLLETNQFQSAPQPSLRPQEVNLVDLARRLTRTYQGLTDRHSLTVEDAGPRELIGSFDPDAIRRILDNMLSNAIKYSPEGGPVTVTAARVGNEARLAVRDRGIGIPTASLSSIFEQFYRAPNAVGAADGEDIEGRGLGLFSAQNLAERLGGRIEVVSVEGEGATFTLVLPLAPAASG